MRADTFSVLFFFFFNDTATTEIYTLSLHDALPISFNSQFPTPNSQGPLLGAWELGVGRWALGVSRATPPVSAGRRESRSDRKSTRLNSSHSQISYAVFCLKKKTQESSHADAERRQN